MRGEPVQEERWELDLGEELELASLEWRPAPERERRPELLHAFDVVASRPRIHNELRKLPEVRLLRRYVQAIAGRLFRDHVGAEQPPKLGDGVLERLLRRLWRPLAPERVDQAIGRNDLADMERQEGEQRSLLRPAQGHGAVANDRLDRPEDAQLHRSRRFITPNGGADSTAVDVGPALAAGATLESPLG